MSFDLADAFAIAAPRTQDDTTTGPPMLPPWKLLDDTLLKPVRRVTECYICFDPAPRNVSILSRCGHQFCTPCLKEWDKHSDKCPMCRTAVGGGRMKLRTYVKKQHPVLQAPTKIDMEKPWNDGVREDDVSVNPKVAELEALLATCENGSEKEPGGNKYTQLGRAIIIEALSRAMEEPIPTPPKW